MIRTGSGWLPFGANALPSPSPCNYPYHQSGYACQLPPPLGEEALGWVGALGTATPKGSLVQRELPRRG